MPLSELKVQVFCSTVDAEIVCTGLAGCDGEKLVIL